jgi:hypothetical protein
MTLRRTASAAVALLAVAWMLAACSSATPETTPTTPPQVTTEPESPEPDVTSTTAPEATGELTCEGIIPPEVVASLEAEGWSARQESFRIGALEIVEGLQCTWGDYSVATDHVQVFGWAPIDPTAADTAASDLVSSGWRREEGEGGFYVTESAQSAFAPDEDGYGFTYFFGPGWVTLADTRQSLLLVEGPAV